MGLKIAPDHHRQGAYGEYASVIMNFNILDELLRLPQPLRGDFQSEDQAAERGVAGVLAASALMPHS